MRLTIAGHDVYAYTGSREHREGLPTLLFVHGAANDHSVWTLQSRYFAHHGWNVLAIDLPGHGRSNGEALASVDALAAWIVAVLDALRAATAALVGHSLGALGVLECAARHPDRVAKAVLIGPAAPMTVSDDLLAAAKADDHVALELINGWSYSAEKQLGGNAQPGIWLVGNAMRLMERTPRGVLYADLRACNDYAGGVAAATLVRCPVLLLLGARDIMAPPRNAQGLIAALPGASVVTLPECGHAIMAEQPDAVLDALRSFL
jgi:pimeloyl-ACP methyl ester carboxylesterase